MRNFSLGTAELETAVSLNGLEGGLGQAKATATNAIQEMGKSISSTLTFAIAGGLGAIGGAVAYVWKETFSLAQDINKSQRMLQTQLELTAEEATATADTVKEVWANNFGGSIEEVREDLTAVYQNMQRLGDVSQEELQGATWEQAMDIIAAGNRRGMNTSGDSLGAVIGVRAIHH